MVIRADQPGSFDQRELEVMKNAEKLIDEYINKHYNPDDGYINVMVVLPELTDKLIGELTRLYEKGGWNIEKFRTSGIGSPRRKQEYLIRMRAVK